MLALSARTFISHDPPIAEPDDPERSKRETEKQKRINLEGTLPFPPSANTLAQRIVDKYRLLTSRTRATHYTRTTHRKNSVGRA
jgi:hypothetical protein